MTGEIHRVAIFEDSSVDRFIYERNLEHMPFSYDARMFQTPDEGLHNAHYLQFDVVIIHINFWGTNYGFQIMNEMKKICRNNPVFIGVTSYLPEDEIESMISKGFRSVYEKPFMFNHLEEILAQVTETEFAATGRAPYAF